MSPPIGFHPQHETGLRTTRVPLDMMKQRERGLFDELQADASKVIDLFSGVSQADIASGNVDTSKLSREDKIEALVDGSTSSVFGSSPWSIGLGLDGSVADQIHGQNGATLVFAISSTLVDLAESKVRSVRYALIWDDSIISETGTIDLDIVGSTFLIVGVKNEVVGQRLTLWITDNDLIVRLVQSGGLGEIEKIRADVIGKLGAAAKTDGNPFTAAVNQIGSFLTVSQIGGLVALAVIGVVLVLVVRSESFKDVAKAAAKAV